MKCSYKTASHIFNNQLVQLLDRVPPLRSRGMPAIDATHTAGGGCLAEQAQPAPLGPQENLGGKISQTTD